MKILTFKLDTAYIYAFIGEATLGLTFIFYILIARILGPEQYGIFAAATALGGMLSLFIRFGFPALLERDVAVDPKQGPGATLPYLLLEVLTALLVLSLLFPVSRTLGFQGIGIIACYLAVLGEVGRSAKTTLRAVLRGLGWFRLETITVAIERSVMILAAVIVLLLTHNMLLVLLTLAIARLIDSIGLINYLQQRIRLSQAITLQGLRQSIVLAYPFALSGILILIYYQIDLVMLQKLSTAEQTGFYSAAYRTMEIFWALPRVAFYVLISKLARCYAQTPDRLPGEIAKATRILLVAVVPVLAIAGYLQPLLIEKLYGPAFAPALGAFAIILPNISLNTFSMLARKTMTAIHREDALPLILFVTVMLNILLNLFLIPRMGALGAALATLISEFILLTMSLGFLIQVGFRRVGILLWMISLLSFTICGIPSLILFHQLTLSLGIVLMLLSGLSIIVLARPRYWAAT